MVIIQIAGGVGNQLQQYALYQKFLSIGVDARLDISWFDGLSHNTTTKRELEFGFFTDLNYKCCTLKEKEKL
ncbi:MAG: alpha-1,2-fucosyltransferase, partial [Lachnospiraceae bacterium]|nr:alpha-1,2-fucosyltransferase [Lachnospiraceae bacterium]